MDAFEKVVIEAEGNPDISPPRSDLFDEDGANEEEYMFEDSSDDDFEIIIHDKD